LGRTLLEDVLIDEGAIVNIITQNLITKLSLPKLRLILYHLKMANQSMTRPFKIIKILRMHIHGVPYVATFTIFKNSVVDFNHYMLLGKPWFIDAKVIHD
jgi:hypothetical protein